jgi:hypothetical protein
MGQPAFDHNALEGAQSAVNLTGFSIEDWRWPRL